MTFSLQDPPEKTSWRAVQARSPLLLPLRARSPLRRRRPSPSPDPVTWLHTLPAASGLVSRKGAGFSPSTFRALDPAPAGRPEGQIAQSEITLQSLFSFSVSSWTAEKFFQVFRAGWVDTPGKSAIIGIVDASVAHLVERHLAKVEVASSSLVTRSSKDICLWQMSFSHKPPKFFQSQPSFSCFFLCDASGRSSGGRAKAETRFPAPFPRRQFLPVAARRGRSWRPARNLSLARGGSTA